MIGSFKGMVQGYFRATFLAIFYFSFSDLLIFILRSFVLEYTIVQRVQQILFFSLRVYRPLFLVHYCIFSQPIIALEFLINFFASLRSVFLLTIWEKYNFSLQNLDVGFLTNNRTTPGHLFVNLGSHMFHLIGMDGWSRGWKYM